MLILVQNRNRHTIPVASEFFNLWHFRIFATCPNTYQTYPHHLIDVFQVLYVFQIPSWSVIQSQCLQQMGDGHIEHVKLPDTESHRVILRWPQKCTCTWSYSSTIISQLYRDQVALVAKKTWSRNGSSDSKQQKTQLFIPATTRYRKNGDETSDVYLPELQNFPGLALHLFETSLML